MDELIEVTARQANHQLAELLRAVETRGQGYLVTKHGRPVARILPVEHAPGDLTAAQQEALDLLLASDWDLGGEAPDRDSLHER